jgi:hypothetical protein
MPDPPALTSTGEFRAADLAAAGEAILTPAVPPGTVTCSYCGKPASAVKKILSGQTAQICDECVRLCYLVLRDELPNFPDPE